jgi:hypothetical protein
MNDDRPYLDSEQSADDPELWEIERLLIDLPLREPSPMLDRRVRRMVRAGAWLEKARLIGLGAAAMLALGLGVQPLLPHRTPSAPVAPGGTQPKPIKLLTTAEKTSSQPDHPLLVRYTNSHVSDDGIVGFVGSTPLQRLRRHSVQQLWLIDPKTGARVAVTVPRDEVVVRKVQTF